ncbi:MAG: hypothetical protein KAI63_08685 [Planctomycetes bacterium]|nr:hypothetical protein [Planctomycetota bacterium]
MEKETVPRKNSVFNIILWIVLTILGGVYLAGLLFIIPNFNSAFESLHVVLPGITKLTLFLSFYLRSYWFGFLPVLFVLWVGLGILAFVSWPGKIRAAVTIFLVILNVLILVLLGIVFLGIFLPLMRIQLMLAK